MIFVVNGSRLVYLPFFSFNGHEYRSPAYALSIVLTLFLTLLSIVWTFRVCWIVWKVRVFHVNMSIISNVYFLQYFEVVVGKVLMAPWQYGFFSSSTSSSSSDSNSTTHFLAWASREKSKMPQIGQFADALPMFVGGFIIWHYMMSMVFFIFFYCLERVIATLLLGSYEKHSRAYISVSILIVANLSTLLVTHLLFFVHIEFISSVYICSVVVAVSVVMYISILLVNVRISSELKNDTFHKRKKTFNKYSLAYRFQLEENLRAFQLARKVIVWIGFYIICNILIIFLINLDVLSASWNLVLVFIVENCIYLNPLLICTVTVSGIEPWRLVVVRDFSAFFKTRVKDAKIHQKVQKTSVSGETEIYFRDLKAMWA